MIVYYTIAFFISLYVTILCCGKYKKLRKSKYQMNNIERSELKLISEFSLINISHLSFTVHSCVMFLFLGARYVYQAALLISTLMKSTNIITIAQLILPVIGSFYSLCGSTMLLILSKQVRRDFFQFYGKKLNIVQNVSRSTET